MATTTTYGYKKPSIGDKQNVWTSALEHNIDRGDLHAHDGITAPKIESKNLTKTIQSINNTGWTLISNGNYQQTVAMAAGYAFSTGLSIKFFVDGGLEDSAEVYLSIEKVTDTSFKIYTNDNTLSLKAVYA